MGGRGSSSGLGKNTDGVIVSDKKEKLNRVLLIKIMACGHIRTKY